MRRLEPSRQLEIRLPLLVYSLHELRIIQKKRVQSNQQSINSLPRLLLGDSQINAACRAFVSDVNFKSTGDSITGWQLLNLLNGSVKSSYIDNFLERNLNCTEFVQGIQRAKLGDSEYAWFLG